jgi:isocitrate dehydrogenase
MGQKPEKLKAASYSKEAANRKEWSPSGKSAGTKVDLVGVDLYIASTEPNGKIFGDALQKLQHDALELTMISSRGVAIWPEFMSETFTTDDFRCRFTTKTNGGSTITHAQILGLAEKVTAAGYDIVKLETLRNFNGKPGYSLAQGQ